MLVNLNDQRRIVLNKQFLILLICIALSSVVISSLNFSKESSRPVLYGIWLDAYDVFMEIDGDTIDIYDDSFHTIKMIIMDVRREGNEYFYKVERNNFVLDEYHMENQLQDVTIEEFKLKVIDNNTIYFINDIGVMEFERVHNKTSKELGIEHFGGKEVLEMNKEDK